VDNKQPLKDLVKKIISDLEKRDEKEEHLKDVWEKSVGESGAKHTKIAFLKGKRLVVNVSDSTRLYKLTLEKKNLINKLNENIKSKKKIKELQFRIGKIERKDK